MFSMKNYLIIFFILGVTVSGSAQTESFGKLFSKQEADSLYGPFLVSIAVDQTLIDSLCTVSDSVLMFNLINNKVIILDRHRKVLYSDGKISFNNKTVFRVFPIAVIKEMLLQSSSNLVYIEKRKDVLSISNGSTVMDLVDQCPPKCP